MKKLFHFDSSRERYECDAAVVWCFDNRFEAAFRKFLKRIGVATSDPIKIAGGAKSLASPASEADREFILQQIRTSMRLHGAKRVVLMLHSDCGAYGGLESFGNDVEAERENHRWEMKRAIANLEAAIPGVAVEGYFVDFEGVWSIEPLPAAASPGPGPALRDSIPVE